MKLAILVASGACAVALSGCVEERRGYGGGHGYERSTVVIGEDRYDRRRYDRDRRGDWDRDRRRGDRDGRRDRGDRKAERGDGRRGRDDDRDDRRRADRDDNRRY